MLLGLEYWQTIALIGAAAYSAFSYREDLTLLSAGLFAGSADDDDDDDDDSPEPFDADQGPLCWADSYRELVKIEKGIGIGSKLEPEFEAIKEEIMTRLQQEIEKGCYHDEE